MIAMRGGWHVLRWTYLLVVFAASTAWSDAVIHGTVSDILGDRVSGARIVIRYQGAQLQEGVTDTDGSFRLEVDFGRSGDLDLVAEHPGYAPAPVTVHIQDFEPSVDSHLISVMPRELAPCASKAGAIIVGKFLPPVSQSGSDLTGHVHRMLSFRILAGLQIEQLRDQLDLEHRHLVPRFVKCEGANPSSESQGKIMARALGAQGLVWGLVAVGDAGFDLDTSVADVVDVFDPPFTTTSENVDLGSPREAVISPEMRAAVIVALMANLEKAGQCQAVIHASNFVRTLTPDGNASGGWQVLAAADREIRERCQQSIPDAGLVEAP